MRNNTDRAITLAQQAAIIGLMIMAAAACSALGYILTTPGG